MKNIKKISILLVLFSSLFVFFSCASNKVELSDVGKTGSIKVKVGSHITVTAIDGMPTKFKTSFLLEPGEHCISIDYYKFNMDYTLSASLEKRFIFEEGKNYTLNSIQDISIKNKLCFPIREDGIQKFSQTKTSVKPFEDPETNNGKNIQVLSKLPVDKKFEIVGEYQFTLAGGIFALKSLTDSRAILYFQEYVFDNDIDAVVDPWVLQTFSGMTVNAIGIRYIDE